MNSLLTIAVIGACYLNLPLQTGIGAYQIFSERRELILNRLLGAAVLFVSVFLQWIFFEFVITPLSFGFAKYFIVLPLSAVVPSCLQILSKKFFPQKDDVLSYSYISGAGLASFFFVLCVAGTMLQALTAAVSIAVGVVLSGIIVDSIKSRIQCQAEYAFIRGGPLLFITLGILSLTLMSTAIICLG